MVKTINNFFKTSSKKEIDSIMDSIYLTERQEKICKMKYLKGQDIGFIADTIYVSRETVCAELKAIRLKIINQL